jgi:two-component system sensor histidine kinase KdpD
VSARNWIARALASGGHTRHALALGSSAILVTVVTVVIEMLDRLDVPVLSLAALYLFAIVPIALFWGVAYAIGASVASVLAFNFFFLPPLYTFTLADSNNWFALLVYLVTAVVVSELAARVRRRAAEAEQRGRESALIADAATALLRGENLENELEALAERVASVLRVPSARIELGAPHEPPPGVAPLELRAGGRLVGTLYVPEATEPTLAIRRRFLPGLASLLAVAAERERLERDALEAETLRRSDLVKTAVLRAVSHDLRSPLTAIQTAVDGLRSSSLAISAEEREALLVAIQEETRRLERLVQNLLDLSRLQARAARPAADLWPVDELVGQALAELGDPADRVVVSVPASIPPVRVDSGQIERVLVNLLENALKFSPEGSPVHVSASATRNEVLVRVTDQGPGVAPRDLERIFEPFEHGPGAARGTGLGLAICRGFAEANGGRVWAESQAGEGAIFVLALPAARVPVEAGAA